MALELKWLKKNNAPVDTGSILGNIPPSEFIITGLTSADIKTRLVGINVSVWKNGVSVLTFDLSHITNVDIQSNRVTVYSDDSEPVTLVFVNPSEASLAHNKFADAGNGAVV